MVKGNHWDQWFSDGFQVRQPLVTMVFDGCAPSVRRWNGYVPSLKSTPPQTGNAQIEVVTCWKVLPLHKPVLEDLQNIDYILLYNV